MEVEKIGNMEYASMVADALKDLEAAASKMGGVFYPDMSINRLACSDALTVDVKICFYKDRLGAYRERKNEKSE